MSEEEGAKILEIYNHKAGEKFCEWLKEKG